MSENEKEDLLADCVEDYHRHRALREVVDPESYRERLGEYHRDLLDVLAAEEALDRAVRLGRNEPFPRPFGEYTLVRELGRGAAGVVFEAVHRPLGRKVAIKILRTGFDTEPIALKRFRQEAQACAQIRHEHVVEIYEAGEFEGRPYYAMPLIEGESLSKLIKTGRVPEPRELCRGLAGIADALAEMHHAGIVHRDIKPSNLMVDPGGRMILADFGLARSESAQTLTRTGQALGTPLYMSPEQLLGQREAIDGRTDVYGMGVTLYEALAGRTPFQADNLTTLMRMILSERPAPMADVAPDVPKACANIAMKAMEQRREDRYESAEALREDLLHFADGEAVSGRPVSPLRVFLRRRGRSMLSAAAVLLIAVVAFVAWDRGRPAHLEVACFPAAQVLVDGEVVGTTPVVLELAAGDHEVVLRHEGFRDRTHRISIEPGSTRSIETVIIAQDADDPEVLRRLGEELQVAFSTLELDSLVRRVRGGPDEGLMMRTAREMGLPPVYVLYPRDEVRLTDLAAARVDLLDVMYEPDGAIRFLRGEEVLHEVPYDPDEVATTLTLPESLREALRPGDEVTWGYFPREGAPVTAVFRVIGREKGERLARRLAHIEKRLAGQPAALLGHLRTQIFLNLKLNNAAMIEAKRVCEMNDRSPRAWAARAEAINRLHLEETTLGQTVLRRLEALPENDE